MPFKNPDPIYNVWQSMKRRCDSPNTKQYRDYGGRGIAVCERWLHSFANFKADMGARPLGHTLERGDNDLGYSPANCKWATRKAQQRNRRCTRKIIISGTEYIVTDLAEIAGVKTDTIVARAAEGLSYEGIISRIKRHPPPPQTPESIAKARKTRLSSTRCSHGHEWSLENTRITPQGWRNCRTCARLKMRKRTADARTLRIDMARRSAEMRAHEDVQPH